MIRSSSFSLAVLLCVSLALPAGIDAVSVSSPEFPEGENDSQGIVRVTFAAMGDVPYSKNEADRFEEQVTELPEEAEFLIHVGDIKRGFFPCLESAYISVAETLRLCKAPVFIIPGDNEWNDCPLPARGAENWRKHFTRFDEHWESDFEVSRQEELLENFAFVHERVLFIGLNLVGGRVLNREKWNARLELDADWVDSQVKSRAAEVDFVVVFTHAGPGENHDAFFDRFVVTARWFIKPVLVLHGDGHRWKYDQPFDQRNIYRIQVDQGGIAPPVIVKVVSGERQPFQFDRGEKYGANSDED